MQRICGCLVNREQMLDRLIAASQKAPRPMTYEIGSNSDLVLENQVTGNLTWTIPAFAEKGRGFLTFPTKFADVGPLLGLQARGENHFPHERQSAAGHQSH